MDDTVQRHYDALVAAGRERGAPAALQEQSERFATGWRSYRDEVLARLPVSLTGRVVADLGCKFGHLAPLVLESGAARFVGIDVTQSYLDAARELLAPFGERVSFARADPRGYLPLESESVDVVLVIEVISHIAPSSLDTLLAELARVVRKDGWLLISDGNNARYPGYVESLRPFWEAWENGPDGVQTAREVVDRCYRSLRRDWIAANLPELDAERAAYLARNTSGLHGEFFHEVARRYAETGELVERPYRPGQVPVHPEGFVMERAFPPQQVVLALEEHGFAARQVLPRPRQSKRGLLFKLGYWRRMAAHYLDGMRRKPGWPDGLSQTFTVVGRKR